MAEILQATLPFDPTAQPHMLKLPGTVPLAADAWLIRDEAFAGQMQLRDRLVAERPEDVMAAVPGADAAIDELLCAILRALASDTEYSLQKGGVLRPDGVLVARDLPPLVQLARLVQEDLCLLLPGPGAQHMLAAATLLFPAHWTLAEKLGRPLAGVHRNVPPYDDDVARRVQRLFDRIRPGHGLWRFNIHGQKDTGLYAPLTEADAKPRCPVPVPYLRSERQSFTRLPESGAVVFAIHTYLVPRSRLTAAQRDLLDETVAT